MKQTTLRKLPTKPKIGTTAFRDQALGEIFKYYVTLHQKNNIKFEEQENQFKLSKGQLNRFCKEFNVEMPPSKII